MMALVIAAVVILVTVISLALFGLHIWWFPEVISSYGLAIDRQFKNYVHHHWHHFRAGGTGFGVFRLAQPRSRRRASR